jgi:hypothetical protein
VPHRIQPVDQALTVTLRYFGLNGTDHRTHAEQGNAIGQYLRWRNARARPKRDFAPSSVIPDLD